MNTLLKIIIRMLLIVIAPVWFAFIGAIWAFLVSIVTFIEIIIRFIITGNFDIDSNYLIVDRFEDFIAFIKNHCTNTLKKYDILN